MASTRKAAKKYLTQNILLIAVIFLIVGVFLFILPILFVIESGQTKILDSTSTILISGGFFSILIYLIVGRHDQFVLRHDILGIRDDQTLLGSLQFSKYVYDKRIVQWKLLDIGEPKWGLELKDIFHIKVLEDTDHIMTIKGSDVKLRKDVQDIDIVDKASGVSTPVTPSLDPDLTTSVKRYFKIAYEFKAGHDYIMTIPYIYSACMKNDADYLDTHTPVLTRSLRLEVIFPPSVNPDDYIFDCFLMDLRFVKGRRISMNKDLVQRLVYFDNEGPINPGETVILRYKKKPQP
jgi:hypothetical protein